jgi:hypothetical protein
MLGDDPFVTQQAQGLLARLTRDPVRLRGRARWSTLALSVIAALASDGLGGWLPGLLYPLCWLVAVPLAFAIGFGDAFFLSHGRGLRRVLLTLPVGAVVSLTSCALLSTTLQMLEGGFGRIIDAALYGALLLAVIFLLAALVALALSRGSQYAARQIARLDDEGW